MRSASTSIGTSLRATATRTSRWWLVSSWAIASEVPPRRLVGGSGGAAGGGLGPVVGRRGELASVPRAAPDLHRRLQERELVGPGGEAAVAAEVVELGQDGHERVVGALDGEIVEVGVAQVRAATAARDLEARGAQQQRVQAGDRPVALGTVRAQSGEPRFGVAVVGDIGVCGQRGQLGVSDAGAAGLTSE
jgi:hypothetical protein